MCSVEGWCVVWAVMCCVGRYYMWCGGVEVCGVLCSECCCCAGVGMWHVYTVLLRLGGP